MTEVVVSIVVPVYNVEAYIERCAKSLLEQTYGSIEYIFIEDASSDRSAELLRNLIAQYPHRRDAVRIISHEKNQGLFYTRQDGFAAVTGKYLLCVDSDDWLGDDDVVRRLVQTAEDEQAEIVVFAVRLSFLSCESVIDRFDRIDREDYLRSILSRNRKYSNALWGKLYRSSFFLEIYAKLSGIPPVTYGEDQLVLAVLIGYVEKIACRNDVYYVYNLVNASSSTHSFSSRHLEDLLFVEKYHTDFFQREFPDRYETELRRGKIANRILMLKAISAIKGVDEGVQDAVFQACRELDAERSLLTVSDRILLGLGRRPFFPLLKLLVRGGLAVKSGWRRWKE